MNGTGNSQPNPDMFAFDVSLFGCAATNSSLQVQSAASSVIQQCTPGPDSPPHTSRPRHSHEKIDAHKAETQEKDEIIDELKQKETSIRQEIQGKEVDLIQQGSLRKLAEEALKSLQEKYNEQQAVLESSNSTIEVLSAELKEHGAQWKDIRWRRLYSYVKQIVLRIRLEKLRAEMGDIQAQSRHLEKTISDLRTTIDSKDVTIAELGEKLRAHEETIQTHEGTIEEQKEAIKKRDEKFECGRQLGEQFLAYFAHPA